MNNKIIPEISIIVPVYNAESFIENTIKSILKQSFTNFEAVLVNDGSQDNSLKVCNIYAKKDNRIKIFNQENSGVTYARKTGIDNSIGNFILFLDADDELPSSALETLYKYSKNVDVVIGFDDDPLAIPHKKSKIIDGNRAIKLFLSRKLNVDVAAKLWKRSLFDNNTMNTPQEINIGEDFIMNIKLMKNVSTAIIVYKNVYKYNHHNQQTTSTFHYNLEYAKVFDSFLIRALENYVVNFEKEILLCRINELKYYMRNGINFDIYDNFVKTTCNKAILHHILEFSDYIFILFRFYPKLCCFILNKTLSIKRKLFKIYH